MTDIDAIRKKHDRWKKHIIDRPERAEQFRDNSILTISDVDELFKELDEARKEAKKQETIATGCSLRIAHAEKELAEARRNAKQLIRRIERYETLFYFCKSVVNNDLGNAIDKAIDETRRFLKGCGE